MVVTKGTITIMVRGGVVQSVVASNNIAKHLIICILDLDEPSFMTKTEKIEFDSNNKEWQEIANNPDVTFVY